MSLSPRVQMCLGLTSSLIVIMLGATSALADQGRHPGASGRYHRSVCAVPAPNQARCLAQEVTDSQGQPLASPANVPPGYAPADLQSAYKLAPAETTGGIGRTVAIVDAYHDPNAEADLGVYRSTFGLPACTTTNGCFSQLNQSGAANSPPGTDAGWAQEISLDIDMVSAICPNCHIMLVEANSSTYADLGAAVNTAAARGATAISNSYGGGESPFETGYESAYDHPGIDVTVSSGDGGYGVEFPAASRFVSAVGGTSLNKATTTARGWSESAWSGAGSGCSSYIPKPQWQTDSGCPNRTVADVSAVADPNTGVAVYDSLPNGTQSGWLVFGGTSVASPIVASVDALAGGRAQNSAFGSFPYTNTSQFFDVSGGNNGTCSPSYLCTAVSGYDGPTGIGTPNGAGAAVASGPPANTGVPTITGSDVQGQTLTASQGTWSGSPTSYSYQWQRCSSPTQCTSTGASGATYLLTGADVGSTMAVLVTATNAQGPSPAASSAQTPVVTGPAADFSLSRSPSSLTLRRSASASYTVTVNAINGFASAVTLSVSGLHSGVSPTWPTGNPAHPGTPTTLKLTASSRASTGTYTITIKGAAGSQTHSTTATLTVTR